MFAKARGGFPASSCRDRRRVLFPFHRRTVGPAKLVRFLASYTRHRSGTHEVDIDLGVPLIDISYADAVLGAVLDRLDHRWLTLIEWFAVPEGGAFWRSLQRHLAARRQPCIDLGGWDRALFQPATDATAFLTDVISKRRGKDFLKTFPELEGHWNDCKAVAKKFGKE